MWHWRGGHHTLYTSIFLLIGALLWFAFVILAENPSLSALNLLVGDHY